MVTLRLSFRDNWLLRDLAEELDVTPSVVLRLGIRALAEARRNGPPTTTQQRRGKALGRR